MDRKHEREPDGLAVRRALVGRLAVHRGAISSLAARRGAASAAALLVLLCLAPALAAQQVRVPTGGGAARDAERERQAALDNVRVRIARVKYGGGGDWYSDPSSLPNLAREFSARTGIPVAENEKVVELGEPDLFAYPFLYMTGHGNIRLTPEELERLREHLLRGGFLYADDNYGMDESFRAMVLALFPERRLVPVPFDHRIYHCVYDLEGPPKIHEHNGKPPEGLGVFNGERLMIFYTYESDIGDGLEDPDVHGDPADVRELAMRMAVNILFYALTQ